MTGCHYYRAAVLSSVFLGASITAAQDPVIYSDGEIAAEAGSEKIAILSVAGFRT
jgi:hypothetical protein